MFQFPRLSAPALFHSGGAGRALPLPGFPIRRSAGQRVCAPLRSLSQLATSFFGFLCQGIHRAPLVSSSSKLLSLFLIKYLGIDHTITIVIWMRITLLSREVSFNAGAFEENRMFCDSFLSLKRYATLKVRPGTALMRASRRARALEAGYCEDPCGPSWVRDGCFSRERGVFSTRFRTLLESP